MKKLMLGLAVAAVGSAFAVESSNIVGYTTKDTLSSGNVAVGCSFVSVGTNEFNLADITVDAGGTGSSYYISGTVILQTLYPNGTTKDSYYWFYNKKHGGSSGTAGWYTSASAAADELVTKESNITFKPGEGFWIQGAGKKLVCNGQVLTGTDPIVVKTLASGNVMVANPYPVSVNLADITVDAGGTGSSYYISGTVILQTLNANGTTKDSYYWFYNKKHGGSSGTAGWYTSASAAADELVTKESGIVLGVGEAYWVQGAGKDILFPALDL